MSKTSVEVLGFVEQDLIDINKFISQKRQSLSKTTSSIPITNLLTNKGCGIWDTARRSFKLQDVSLVHDKKADKFYLLKGSNRNLKVFPVEQGENGKCKVEALDSIKTLEFKLIISDRNKKAQAIQGKQIGKSKAFTIN